MEILASIFGGLGLFFLGVKGVGAGLQSMGGRRMRRLMAEATRGPLRAAAMGLLMGALTQSSNAVTFIATSLYTAGLLPLRRALPALAWCNAGTAGLVLLATIDLRLAVLWLFGTVGFATYFGLDGGGRLKPLLGALAGLGLLFLGLATIKAGAAPLRDLPLVREILAFSGTALTPPFLIGVVITLIAQSSSTVSILAITLTALGLLGFEQTVMVVYGASLGSGLSVLLLSGNLSGSARQLALYQTLFKATGTALFLLLFWVEQQGVPLVLAATALLSHDLPERIGWLFLLFQVVTALAVAPLNGAAMALLRRLSPPGAAEALGRPRFLYDQALEHAPTALELVEREQAGLAGRLPGLLGPLLEPAAEAPGQPPRPARLQAAASVEQAVRHFLAELLTRDPAPASLERVVALESRNEMLTALRETVGEFAEAVEQAEARGEADPVAAPLRAMAEALHLLLLQLEEAADRLEAEDLALLRTLAADRSDMMDQLRRRVARAEPGLAPGGHDLLFRATALFERAVWLIRRQALLLEPAATAE
ncbi:Na/Pi symporter [Pseudoroseomonas cervicalis]|uniref:Na/Pi symporter n=1 Tax=Teichococcus cervicalis TaxID=204525 RepID=UPI0022F15453|nr:Na/Pi symporter [Pseudoroseomonas cervicalis]WBV41720.1 Na/Pi symporter [Pseudoroseomonas cervicalis]